MPYQKKELSALAHYVPVGGLDFVIPYLNQYAIELVITKERATIRGRYTHNFATKANKITIVGTLNIFSFFITLLHEIAHCVCLYSHGRGVQPHGKEWQACYATLLQKAIAEIPLPQDIVAALQKNMHNPAASTCAEPELEKVLIKYDYNSASTTLVSSLSIGDHFLTAKGQRMQVLEKKRTRYLCEDLVSNQRYLVPGVYAITKI